MVKDTIEQKISYTDIFRKYAAMFVLTAVIPLVIISVITSFLSAGIIVKQTKTEFNSILQERSSRIRAFVESKLKDSRKIAANPRLIDAVRSSDPGTRLAKELALFADGHDYYDVMFADRSGRIISSAKKEADLGQNILESSMFEGTNLRDRFVEMKRTGETGISSFEFYKPSDTYAMFVMTPVYTGKDTAGYLVLQINNNDIDELVSDVRGTGKSTEILFAVKYDDSALFITNLAHIRGGAFRKAVNFNDRLGTPIQEAVNCRNGQGVRRDYFGIKVLAVWGCEKITGWGIVVKRDFAEVMKPVREMIVLFIISVLLTSAAAVLIAYFMAKKVAQPLYEIADAAEKAAKGDFKAKVNITSGDETGIIASIFNKMTEELDVSVGRIREMNDMLNLEIEQKKKYMAELERSNRDLEQFAYVASHDLQEPLRTIAGYAQLLQRKFAGRLDEEADTIIGNTVKGTLRMKNLINDLLAYSRIDSKGREFRDVDMNMIFDSVVYGMESQIKENNAVVMKGDLPVIKADETQMMQLLQNLIGNAIKFKRLENIEVKVSAEEKDGEYIFSVKDNGIGIEKKYFDRIFVIFQRLNSKKEYPGTGIGLAICKRVIERHKGRIWLESEPGAGSVFYFTIPKGE